MPSRPDTNQESDVQIRTIRQSDAAAFLQLCHQLDQETEFMLLEPDERTSTFEEQRRRIDDLLPTRNSTILVAEADSCLVGYVEAGGGSYRRERHTAYLVVGILQEFTGCGIGTRLFQAIERWARATGLHRLELTVMSHNQAGIGLYQKMGFQIEGTRREALRVKGAWVDEYYMGKVLAAGVVPQLGWTASTGPCEDGRHRT